jgi:hypothetical protein
MPHHDIAATTDGYHRSPATACAAVPLASGGLA